ncbi:ubiquitin D-like isoform X1 [Notamacropus eugenii]|uniref:ubiquitin D-like isoform X1 n=1 Tax=Notamacropus eugenii TaxID=9315 RepID=UPI003B67F461
MALYGVILHVNVQGHEGELMKFSAWKDDKVWKIKEQIMSEIKVTVENQKLFLGSETLNPEKKLSDYGIDPSTTIHLILKVVKPSNEEQMVPQIKVDKRKKDPVHVKPSGSVSQVKEVNVQSKGQESMEIPAQKDDGVMKMNQEMSTKIKRNVKSQIFLPGSKDGNPEKKLTGNCLAPSPVFTSSRRWCNQVLWNRRYYGRWRMEEISSNLTPGHLTQILK